MSYSYYLYFIIFFINFYIQASLTLEKLPPEIKFKILNHILNLENKNKLDLNKIKSKKFLENLRYLINLGLTNKHFRDFIYENNKSYLDNLIRKRLKKQIISLDMNSVLKELSNFKSYIFIKKIINILKKYINFDNIIPKLEKTPLTIAIESKNINLVKILYKIAGIKGNNIKNDYTVLMLAIINDSTEILKFLTENNIENINKKGFNGYTPLIFACILNKLDMVKILLKMNADVDLKDNFGYTALMYGVECGFKNIVKEILKYYPKIDITNPDGDTAFTLAAKNNNKKILKLLYYSGANINHKNNENNTALHYCFEAKNNSIIDFLLENGAKTDIVNKDGYGLSLFITCLKNKKVYQLKFYNKNKIES